MAILGCDEGDSACRQVRLVETSYRTETACMAATGAELARNDDLLFPAVVAQCRPANAAARPVPASEVRLPEPEPTSVFPPLRQARGVGQSGPRLFR
jgi:hypothetical protein